MSKIVYQNLQEMLNGLAESIKNGEADIQRDNYGQVVVYGNIFEWNDGTFRDEVEPPKLK